MYLKEIFAERGLSGLGPRGGLDLLHAAEDPQVAGPVRVLALLRSVLASALKFNRFYLEDCIANCTLLMVYKKQLIRNIVQFLRKLRNNK